jgi:hypothetical protein
VEESARRWRSVSRINVLIAITAAIIGLIYGYDLGSIASALLFLVPASDLNTFMTSVVTSAAVLGQLFGALYAGCISNTIGRKRSLVLVALGYAAFAGLGLHFRVFPRAPAHPGRLSNAERRSVRQLHRRSRVPGRPGLSRRLGYVRDLLGPGLVRLRLRTCPETKGRPLQAIRTYWYNGRRWSEESSICAFRKTAIRPSRPQQVYPSSGIGARC